MNFNDPDLFTLFEQYDKVFKPIPQDKSPDCEYPTGDAEPFIVEAPVNSVEVLEEVPYLKPQVPFEIFTAKLPPRVPRSCAPRSIQKLYQEYAEGQGKLSRDDRQEVSIVCAPSGSLDRLREVGPFARTGSFWPQEFHYMSIPWRSRGSKRTRHPYALVLWSSPGPWHSYQRRLKQLLKKKGLTGCNFDRSLLEPGTSPLPESWLDLVTGGAWPTKPLGPTS